MEDFSDERVEQNIKERVTGKKVAKKKVAKKKAVKRVYKGDQEVDHDLFKLKLASAKKNVSWTDKPRYEMVPHQHFFHTYDSSGKKQAYCSPVAGHTHKVEVEEVDGEFKLVVGPAIKKSRSKTAPIPHDDHTHDVEYVLSEKLTVREANKDAQNDIARRA